MTVRYVQTCTASCFGNRYMLTADQYESMNSGFFVMELGSD